MVPQHLIQPISDRLTEEFGQRDDIGQFVFTFASLPSGHDMDYALDEMSSSDTDSEYRKAVGVFVGMITNG